MTFRSRIIAPLVALSALAACDTGTEPTVMARTCDLPKHQALVGMNIGEVSFPAVLNRRVISSGMPFTEDYNPSRLNLFVDEKGWIARVTCG
ncbi:hypothetical protein H4P12_10625 [Paracoccus sp. 11-3]|uniref:Peptidase inhibitor I78 family protein n=1 Tax=Paracoccus amoyensis TaxID=2760093 RepID=A0A926J6E5_9RHOB|nr:I78 family peptidase inhibitor [Paracoccus amoyensis]MBC9247162.1 hypothetical protein [Paracoccus amoyensis]